MYVIMGAKGLNNVNPFGGGYDKGIRGCKKPKVIKGCWKKIKGIKGCWKKIKGIKGCSKKIKGIRAVYQRD